jgi:hypothetical protein
MASSPAARAIRAAVSALVVRKPAGVEGVCEECRRFVLWRRGGRCADCQEGPCTTS